MATYIVHSNSLAHFGIKGMHWGIRRYQPYPENYPGEGKYIGKIEKLKAKKTKNEAKLAKYRSKYKESAHSKHRQIQRNKLQTYKEQLDIKQRKLEKKNYRAKQKLQYGKNPNFFQRRSLNKEFVNRGKLNKVNEQIANMDQVTRAQENKITSLERKSIRYDTKISRLEKKRIRAGEKYVKKMTKLKKR